MFFEAQHKTQLDNPLAPKFKLIGKKGGKSFTCMSLGLKTHDFFFWGPTVPEWAMYGIQKEPYKTWF